MVVPGPFVELSQLTDNNVSNNYLYQPPVLSYDNIPAAEIKLNSIHQCWRPDLSQSDVIQQICHLMILPLHFKYLLINICNKHLCYEDIFLVEEQPTMCLLAIRENGTNGLLIVRTGTTRKYDLNI